MYVAAIIDGRLHLRCCGPVHECQTDRDISWLESAVKQLAGMVRLPNLEFGIFLGDEPAFDRVGATRYQSWPLD